MPSRQTREKQDLLGIVVYTRPLMSGRFPGLWLLSSVVCVLLFAGNTSAEVLSDPPPESTYDLTAYFAVDPALEKAYQLYFEDFD